MARVRVLVHASSIKLWSLNLRQTDIIRVAVILFLGLVAGELLSYSPSCSELAMVLIELKLVRLLLVRRGIVFDISLLIGRLSFKWHLWPIILVKALIVLIIGFFEFVGHVVLLVVCLSLHLVLWSSVWLGFKLLFLLKLPRLVLVFVS